jgi:hypothetical protein
MFRTAVILVMATAWARVAQASVVNCDPTANTLYQCVASATTNGTTAGTVVLVPNSTNSAFNISSTVPLSSNLTLRCEPNATITQNGARGALLMASGVQNIVVEGCIIYGSNGATPGLVLDNVSGVRVSHNTFQSFLAEGLTGEGWTDVEVDGNVFSSAGPTLMNDSALYLYAQNGAAGSSRIKIHHNTCNNISQQSGCMKFAASSAKTLTQVAVTSNTLNVGTGSSTYNNLGIEFFATDGNAADIQQFTVTDNAGVSITNNNIISSTGAAAIHISASFGGSYGLFTGIVGHNVIRSPAGSTAGVLVQTFSAGTVDDVHIDDNMLDSFTSSQRAVDSEGSPAQVQIENNRFINDSGTGIFLNAGTNFTIRLNYFNGTTWLSNHGATITRSIENIVNGACCY